MIKLLLMRIMVLFGLACLMFWLYVASSLSKRKDGIYCVGSEIGYGIAAFPGSSGRSDIGWFWDATSSVDWKGLPLALKPRFKCCFSHQPSDCGRDSSLETLRNFIFSPFMVWIVAPVCIPTSSGLPSNTKS